MYPVIVFEIPDNESHAPFSYLNCSNTS